VLSDVDQSVPTGCKLGPVSQEANCGYVEFESKIHQNALPFGDQIEVQQTKANTFFTHVA